MWSDTISLECQQILLTVRTTGFVRIKETMSQDCRPFLKFKIFYLDLYKSLKRFFEIFAFSDAKFQILVLEVNNYADTGGIQQIMVFRVIFGEKFKVLIYLEGI